MFNRRVIGVSKVLERDTPCDDAGYCCAPPCTGRSSTSSYRITKTDGNIGESIRDGLTEAETLESRNVIRLSGILGFRHTLEKFLFEANDHFTAKERRAMLYDLDNFCASLLGDRLADVRKVSGKTKVRQELRESLDLVHGIRARAARPPEHPTGPAAMRFVELAVDGAYRIEVEPREDERGFFAAWCAKELQDHGCEGVIAQMNLSTNLRAGTIRGLHVQAPPHGEVLPLHRRT